MRSKFFIGGALVTAGLMAIPAQGSYMAKCNQLISAWEQCRESGSACKYEHQQIVEQCKCHRLRQGSWKLVTAAVGKDGVCAASIPEDVPPPPPEPPKRKPVTTYGGERGPGAHAPEVGRDGPWFSDPEEERTP